MASDSQIEDYRRVIAKLITLCPNEEIKKVIEVYNPSLHTSAILKNLKVVKVDKLRETYKFLTDKDSSAKKDELIILVVDSIKNLFPEKCEMCHTDYVVEISDKPLLTCKNCNQGCHNLCMKNFTRFILEMPPGFSWLCFTCSEEMGIESVKISKRSTKISNNQTSSNEGTSNEIGQTNPSSEENLVVNASAPPITEMADDPPETQDSNETPNQDLHQQPIPTVSHDQIPNLNPPVNPNYPRPNTHNGQPPSRPPPQVSEHVRRNNSTNLCKFFVNSRCRFGIRGNECPNGPHPQVCPKYMRRGTFGCNLGPRCNKYHPKLCYDAVYHRKCLNLECKYLHVKGTFRGDLSEPHNERSTAYGPTRPSYVPFNSRNQDSRHEIGHARNLFPNPPTRRPLSQIPTLMPPNVASPEQFPPLNTRSPLAQNTDLHRHPDYSRSFLHPPTPPRTPPELMFLETISRLEKKMDTFQGQLQDLQTISQPSTSPRYENSDNRQPQNPTRPQNTLHLQYQRTQEHPAQTLQTERQPLPMWQPRPQDTEIIQQRQIPSFQPQASHLWYAPHPQTIPLSI